MAQVDATLIRVERAFSVNAVSGDYFAKGHAGPGTLSPGGTRALSMETTGNFTRESTGAVAGNTAGVTSPNDSIFQLQYSPSMYFKIKTGSAITTQRIWIGMNPSSASNSDTAPDDFIGFRYSSVFPDTNWVFVRKAGAATQVEVDTGVPVTADTVYTFTVRYQHSGTTIFYSIDGGAEVGYTTDIPSVTLNYGYEAVIFTTAAFSVHFKITQIVGLFDS